MIPSVLFPFWYVNDVLLLDGAVPFEFYYIGGKRYNGNWLSLLGNWTHCDVPTGAATWVQLQWGVAEMHPSLCPFVKTLAWQYTY